MDARFETVGQFFQEHQSLGSLGGHVHKSPVSEALVEDPSSIQRFVGVCGLGCGWCFLAGRHLERSLEHQVLAVDFLHQTARLQPIQPVHHVAQVEPGTVGDGRRRLWPVEHQRGNDPQPIRFCQKAYE